MSKLVEKLARKIKHDLGVEVDPNTFVSIRPKPCYKAAGAWSWEMRVVGENSWNAIFKVGSQWTATECAKRHVKLFACDPHPACFSNEMEIVPVTLF